MEILSKAATKEVVQVILDMIQKREQPDDVTAMLVSRLSGMSFVSSESMIKMMMVCDGKAVRDIILHSWSCMNRQTIRA